MELDLNDIRQRLDGIDTRMIALFCQRMDLVKDVAAYKQERGLPILDAEREARILDRVSEKAGPDLAPYARRVYETLFAVSREYQAERMKDGET